MVTKKQIEEQLKELNIKFDPHEKKDVLESLLLKFKESVVLESNFVEPVVEEKLVVEQQKVIKIEPEFQSTIIDINGKKYNKYFRPDGTTFVELFE